jgi:hypothetical protein
MPSSESYAANSRRSVSSTVLSTPSHHVKTIPFASVPPVVGPERRTIFALVGLRIRGKAWMAVALSMVAAVAVTVMNEAGMGVMMGVLIEVGTEVEVEAELLVEAKMARQQLLLRSEEVRVRMRMRIVWGRKWTMGKGVEEEGSPASVVAV